jgi:hypothetical protein
MPMNLLFCLSILGVTPWPEGDPVEVHGLRGEESTDHGRDSDLPIDDLDVVCGHLRHDPDVFPDSLRCVGSIDVRLRMELH